MRFVIQAVQTAPQLRTFVCEMLSTLVNKAVWTNGSQWKGWVRCVQDLVPDSLPVLLQVRTLLPPSRKTSAIEHAGSTLKVGRTLPMACTRVDSPGKHSFWSLLGRLSESTYRCGAYLSATCFKENFRQ